MAGVRSTSPRPSRSHREIEKSFSLREESWTEYSTRASFEVTNRTSVKAEASAGDIASASAENETITTAKAEFGLDGGSRLERTLIHVAKDHVQVAVGDEVIYWVDVVTRKVVTPVTENGYIEASLVLDLYDWTEKSAKWLRDSIDEKKNRIGCDTIQQLLWFIEGERPAEYPNMRGFLREMRRHSHWSAKGAVSFYELAEGTRRTATCLSRKKADASLRFRQRSPERAPIGS